MWFWRTHNFSPTNPKTTVLNLQTETDETAASVLILFHWCDSETGTPHLRCLWQIGRQSLNHRLMGLLWRNLSHASGAACGSWAASSVTICGVWLYTHINAELGKRRGAKRVEEEFTTSIFCQVHLLTIVLTDCCADSCNPMIHGSQQEKLAHGHPRRLHTVIEQHNADSHAHLGHLRQAFSP